MFLPPRAPKMYKPRRENPPERDFVKLYRFTSESVQWLSDHFLEEDNEETRGGALSAFTKMKIFLRYVADPGFQLGVAEDIGVSQPTVSNTVRYVAQKVVENADTWVRFPQNNISIEEEKHRWQRQYNFPTAIGAIDCTLIKIKKINDRRFGNEYICRKQFPAINVQATCNADELFTSVTAEWPGSVHDSRIWHNSVLCNTLRGFNNAILLGDSGYGVEKCLMTPYRNPVTPEEITFNALPKRERAIIERCFGQVKQRFPILQNTIRVTIENIPTLVAACFILHNVGKYLRDEEVLEGIVIEEEEEENEYEEVEDNNVPGRAELRRQGLIRRNELSQLIYARRR